MNASAIGRTLRSEWDAAGAPPTAKVCDASTARDQAGWFTGQMRARGVMPSACSSGTWMARLRREDLAAAIAALGTGSEDAPQSVAVHRVALNVGANKGYLAAALMGSFVPWSGVSPQFVKGVIDAMPGAEEWTKHACGVCRDCEEVLPPLESGLPPGAVPTNAAARAALVARLAPSITLEVHAFEPQPSNVGILMRVADAVGQLPAVREAASAGSASHARPPVELLIVPAGISDSDGTGMFEERGAGDEGSSLGNANRRNGPLVSVPLRSIDSYVASTVDREQQFVLDIIHIDTEGYDPAALAGAARTLPYSRLVAFEYGSVALWMSTTLQEQVEHLDTLGFTCFLEWADTLLRLTGCWYSFFEFKGWSNVLCVNRRDVQWASAIEVLARV